MNDSFSPVSDCQFLHFNLKIFNRWGQIVFHSTDAGTGWDGKVRDLSAPGGVYVFTLKYQIRNASDEVMERGEVSLLR